MKKLAGACAVLLVLGAGEASGETRFATPAVTPQTPQIFRNVNLIQNYQYQYPYIPSLRTTFDGRVGIPSNEPNKGSVGFFLNVPEKLNEYVPYSFLPVPMPTPSILANPTPFRVPDSYFGPATITYNGTPNIPLTYAQHTICDGTTDGTPAFGQSSATNPYQCPNNSITNSTQDCYDITIISSANFQYGGQNEMFLYGRPFTIAVSNPKTAGASIASVTPTGNWKQNSNQPQQFQALFEPMTTADGHLLVGRTNGGTITWTPPGATQPVNGSYNIVYSAGAQSSTPCDVTQWGTFYPITNAPFDPNVAGIYGFADQPFRDSENNPVLPPYDLEGTYPWIDRAGRNLFFFGVSSSLFYGNGGSVWAQYQETCPSDAGPTCADPATPSDIDNFEATDQTRGIFVVGRWTHGKEVQLDGIFNNIDYGLKIYETDQRVVTLYQSPGPTPSPVTVQLGTGRSNTEGGIPGYVVNTTDLDSFENLFNYIPALRPLSVRDVAWRLNAGKGGGEVAFDDYLDPNALIVSEMVASTTFKNYSNLAGSLPYMAYNNGFTGAGFKGNTVRLQNAATSPFWNVPKAGQVTGDGTARIEPAALGGIQGKGFWLSGGTQIVYAVPSPQPTPSSPPSWFINLFVDPRFPNDTNSRPLVTFTDGSVLSLVGRNQLTITKGSTTYTVKLANALPSPGWSDISLVVQPGGTSIGVYVNGYEYSVLNNTPSMFQLVPGGNITVGGSGSGGGFVGWVDDFKVLAENPDPETICNHARGTLMSVNPSTAPAPWPALVQAYASHSGNAEAAAINAIIKPFGYPTSTYYACYVNYSSDTSQAYYLSSQVNNLPKTGVNSVRSWVHFPEGPLKWNQPRPPSFQAPSTFIVPGYSNNFCLSCHSTSQSASTLQPDVLMENQNFVLQTDPRRQPLQLPRIMYGLMPAGIILGSPGTTNPPVTNAPKGQGQLLDQWDYP